MIITTCGRAIRPPGSGTAQLLPHLIARRTRGPLSLFLTDRKAPAGTPTLDVCPETGRSPWAPPAQPSPPSVVPSFTQCFPFSGNS
ncbi:hypothetical protein SMA5143A_7668 [Streptomyces sp. MA5143a]|nr:hypothetical protein SMA5143A_7668 [Streptomyces sp. MA5143a]